ncbi:DUF1499 domain-containing protein [Oceanicella actignis]|uniref:DUF1499 domain-containing protein n=1 Tax=Oceanicella actignis TaxID=1189325 RepID=A0A1M7S2E5_9RHOB|nr:DUF1499 domain-containing protein [Oceanicella actignis]SES90883.1 Protein of unknown function [Oceanicella actignis]SHN52535.1 Protein of unknown function [Oceanicella actignis]
MRRRARLALAALAGLALAAALWMRLVPDDPARWHVDPLSVQRTGAPNDFLLAPPGAAAPADGPAPVLAADPAALMAAFDAVALAQPRTRRIAGGPEALHATYVQRSALMGFPDYVSARALPVPGGAALAVYSRSRYGRSDLGVNAARVADWLAALRARLR